MMLSFPRQTAIARPRLVAYTALVLALAGGTGAIAQAQTHEITVTIRSVKALDRSDWAGRGLADFYAKVTIAGETFSVPPIKQQDLVLPNWKFTKAVAGGVHKVKVQVLDKDAVIDDVVDINRVTGKRDLDFTVSTGSCDIAGFASGYSCGDVITRAGTERKRAEVAFSVDVRRR
jgi:hypothetical protein